MYKLYILSRAVLTGFIRSRSGNFSIMLGLSMLVLAGGVGVAIDYERVGRAKSMMQDVLDAATLASIHEETKTDAQATLLNYADDHTLRDPAVTDFDAKITKYDSTEIETKATANLPLQFASVLGMDKIAIEVTSIARKADGYQELYFALDLSSSTGVGATQADRKAIEDLTKPYVSAFYGTALPQGCAFGCHRREGWEPGTQTVYDMAKAAGIKMLEDELLFQFSGLVDLLLDPTDPKVAAGLTKLSVFAFSNYAKQLVTPTSSASTVKAALDDFPQYDMFETDFSAAFTKFTSVMGTQGTGSAANPEKMLILITDGIESREAFNAQKAIDTKLCTSFKAKGFTLAVIEIKYPKLIDNFIYDDTVLPVETDISPAMEACASTGWYFQATNNSEIPVKFNEIRNKFGVKFVRLAK